MGAAVKIRRIDAADNLPDHLDTDSVAIPAASPRRKKRITNVPSLEIPGRLAGAALADGADGSDADTGWTVDGLAGRSRYLGRAHRYTVSLAQRPRFWRPPAHDSADSRQDSLPNPAVPPECDTAQHSSGRQDGAIPALCAAGADPAVWLVRRDGLSCP